MPKSHEYKLLPTDECDESLSNGPGHQDRSFRLLPTFEPEHKHHNDSAGEVRVFRSRLGAAAPSALSSGQSDTFLTHSVRSGDTLHGLSLQYGVAVADLKRINGLYADNELCAHRHIRVPVPCHSLLLETTPLSEGDGSGRSSPRSVASCCCSQAGSCDCPARAGRQLLRKVDREVMAVAERWADGAASDGLLSAPAPASAAEARGGPWCAGDDCGLQWYCLFALALLMLLLVPVFFIVAEHETGQLGHHSHEQLSHHDWDTDS